MKEERRRFNGNSRPERTERAERPEKKDRPMRTAYEVRPEPKEEVEGQLEGRNALQEALRAGRTIDKVFIAAGDTDRALQRLAAEAKDAGAVVVPVDRRKLDNIDRKRHTV